MNNIEKRFILRHKRPFMLLIRAAKKLYCSICRESRLKKSERKLGICINCRNN